MGRVEQSESSLVELVVTYLYLPSERLLCNPQKDQSQNPMERVVELNRLAETHDNDARLRVRASAAGGACGAGASTQLLPTPARKPNWSG